MGTSFDFETVMPFVPRHNESKEKEWDAPPFRSDGPECNPYQEHRFDPKFHHKKRMKKAAKKSRMRNR